MMKTTRRKGKASQEATRKRREQEIHREVNKRVDKRIDEQVRLNVESRISSMSMTKFQRFRKAFRAAIVLLLFWVFDSFASVYPRVMVEHLEKPDPTAAFSIPFKISSESFFNLYDVRYSCDLVNAISSSNVILRGFSFLPLEEPVGTLSWGDKATGWCKFVSEVFQLPDLKPIDFVVKVSFRPSFLPNYGWAQFNSDFRFVVTPGEDARVVPNHRPAR